MVMESVHKFSADKLPAEGINNAGLIGLVVFVVVVRCVLVFDNELISGCKLLFQTGNF